MANLSLLIENDNKQNKVKIDIDELIILNKILMGLDDEIGDLLSVKEHNTLMSIYWKIDYAIQNSVQGSKLYTRQYI